MKKTVLITGASGGLGLSFADIFASKGYDLVVVARSEDKLNEIKEKLEERCNISVEVIPCDLAKSGASRNVYSKIQENGINVDILVNNAGFGDFGDFAHCNIEKQTNMVNLNIVALMEMTHCVLSDMKKRGHGRILNVASIAAFQPGPLMSVYYATKAFVLSFTQALAEELKGSGVTVTALCPGPIDTGFEKRADLETSGLFKHLKVWSPEVVAKYGYCAMMHGKVIAIKGGMNKVIVFSNRLAPRALVRKMVYLIQK